MRKQLILRVRYQKMRTQDRKADARRKIQMGGLIIKAGLDHYHEYQKEILFGILLDAAKKLESDQKENYEHKFASLGEEGFKQ
jgi:hypothetical protein